MKTIAIAILLILFVGFAGAVTIPEPTYNFGPSAGFKNVATIQASDLYAEDDFKVGDDAQIVGDLAITGASSFASLYLSSGLNVAGTSALNVTTATSVTAAGTIRGEQLTSTDDALVYGTLTANDVVSNTTVAASDITASDDAIITDDLTVDGGARIDEALTVASVASNGTVTGTSITGSATVQGEQITSTDDMQAYGDLVVNTATVNGTADVNGALTAENITLTQDKRLTFNTAGTGYIQWLTSGNYMTIKGNPQFDDGYTWSGTASPSSGSDLTAIGGASDIDYSLSSGVTKTGSGAVSLNGDTAITGTKTFMVNNGAATFGSSVTAASGIVNTTLDVNGATTTAAITVDSGSIVTADQYKRRTVTNSTNFTITDGGADVYLVGNGTGVNTQTILFPTAADNSGRIITVIVATDPLANTVVLDGENSETINGTATQTTTDAVGSMYHLICNGYAWVKIASLGTWS